MMNKLKFVLFLFFLSLQSYAELSLDKGTPHRDSDSFPQEYKFKIWDLEDVAVSKGVESLSSIISYVPINTETIKYVLGRELTVAKIDLNNKSLLGNWPLTPWPNAVRMKGEGMHWDVRPELIAVKGGEYHAISEPKKMIFDFDSDYDLYTDKNYIGCYNKTPLRYGDIDGSTSNELVIFLNNDLVIFSPDSQKIIFSAQLHTQDELTSNQVRMGFPELEDTAPQYISEKGLKGKSRNARFPAMRSFAKIFIDDFNSDGKKDIIVWRKLYESRLKTDPVLGFKLEGELLVHYQLENGEYQLQTNAPAENSEFVWDDTQQTEIKGWLDSKNLTWQKGFPSKSECAGQEGQLIPEMHDPLLNDPDVLK